MNSTATAATSTAAVRCCISPRMRGAGRRSTHEPASTTTLTAKLAQPSHATQTSTARSMVPSSARSRSCTDEIGAAGIPSVTTSNTAGMPTSNAASSSSASMLRSTVAEAAAR